MNFDIENHLKFFPHSAIMEKEGRLAGCWMTGNDYKAKEGFYGEYPPHYLDRVLSLFPERKSVLHVFGGSLGQHPLKYVDSRLHVRGARHITVDENAKLHPFVTSRAERIDQVYLPQAFDLVLADPPYSKKDCEMYKCKMPNIPAVFRAIRNIITDDGVLVWLCTRKPIYSGQPGQWIYRGAVLLDSGSNRLYRGVAFFEPNLEKI